MAGYKETVARARKFCSRYPTTGRNPFRFILEAFCLPLEVFLRSGFGVSYFHIPKAFLGFLFPFLCMVLVNFGVQFHVSIYPWNMGFIRAYPTVSLPESWGTFWDDIKHAYESFMSLLQTADARESSDWAQFALLAYVIAANFRWLEQIYRERTNTGNHPRSSGESYGIWNPVYWLVGRFYFKNDLVKQFAEPIFCIVLAKVFEVWLKNESGLSSQQITSLEFISVWLGLGGMLLMLKAFIENRSRCIDEYERRANEFDAESFEAADELGQPKEQIAVTTQPPI